MHRIHGPAHRLILLAVPILALVVAGCTPAGGGTVNVTLQEWAVVSDKTEIAAGTVTFEITNDGPNDIHEFVVLKTDIAPGDLPVDENGVVDEAGGAMEVKGEVEDVAVGASETLELELEAGSYVLLCNIWSEEEQEAHYQEGMRTAFTVN